MLQAVIWVVFAAQEMIQVADDNGMAFVAHSYDVGVSQIEELVLDRRLDYLSDVV